MIQSKENENDSIWKTQYTILIFLLIITLNIVDYQFTKMLVVDSYQIERNPLLMWLMIHYDSTIPIIILKCIAIGIAFIFFTISVKHKHRTVYFITTIPYCCLMCYVVGMSLYTIITINTP
jgi:lipoprotein signal peptidase